MSFSPAGNEQVFVQGSNENLWLESPGWQANNSRTFMDANVMSVAANTVEPNGLAFGYVGLIPLADPTAGALLQPRRSAALQQQSAVLLGRGGARCSGGLLADGEPG